MSSRSPTPSVSDKVDPGSQAMQPMVMSVGEQLDSSYLLHELPAGVDSISEPTTSTSEVIVNTALLARIEYLESENRKLTDRLKVAEDGKRFFRADEIAGNDKLVKLYTGFHSHKVLLSFFKFLGPSVNNLTYWGEKERERKCHRQRKLNPLNQFLLTLIKLRLNLCNLDLAVCFGISEALVSRYIATLVCFLHQHLKKIDWVPTVSKLRQHYLITFMKSTQKHLLSLMVVRSSLKHHLIFIYSTPL